VVDGQPDPAQGGVLRREDVPPPDDRRFRSGADCLDLTHTGGEGAYAVFELLHGPRDVERWLGLLVGAPVRAGSDDVARVRDVRNAIGRVARAIAADAPPADDDLLAINDAAAGPRTPVQLTAPGTIRRPAATAEQALGTLAHEAVLLFGGPLAGGRIRVCGADDCGLLFVDRSRPGRRRWCSMERCGNRAKTRSYRSRGDAEAR
jgi:predicted RNA-binding Zn ribbon-like protein